MSTQRWIHGMPRDGGRINVYADERMADRICRVDGGERSATEANARLIAAAPDMLDLLTQVADVLAGGDVPDELGRAIRAVIAKVRGGAA